jgi:CBS domain containing-hemolysin-like protein
MNPELSTLFIQFAAILVLLLLNGFFVSVEFSYVTVPRPRIQRLAATGNPAAVLVQRLLSDTDRVLAASQIGVTVASLGLGWVGENTANQLIRYLFASAPPALQSAVAQAIGLAIVFGLITSLHIVVGEQAPKIIALSAADRIALFSARIVAVFDWLMRPFIMLLDNATEAVVRLLGYRPVGGHHTIYTADELKQLITETQQTGELEVRERQMLHNVFEFGDRLVREVMTPRVEMVAVDEHTTIGEFLQTYREAPHARFPVYAKNIDNITGFVWIKDVLRALAEDGEEVRGKPIKTLSRPATFVPETKRVGRLFAEMQSQKTQLAVVIDEYGGTAGMVTQEELIEEIVGRLGDELAQEPPPVETIDEHTTQVDAQLRVEEVNEQLGVNLPESPDYETIAGYVLYMLHHIPKEGEQFKVGNLRFTVTRMDGLRIEKVLITRL